jgi:hypothetical protein
MSDVKEIDVINKLMPESLKTMISSNQTYKMAEALTGLDELSLEKISCYIGGRVMAHHAKWRPVAEGLVALKKLKG